MFRTVLVLTLLLLLASPGSTRAADPSSSIPREKIVSAVESGLRVIQKGAANYPNNRECFSCHHQTLPMQAMVVARRAKIAIDEKIFGDAAEFSHASFESRLKELRAGDGIGGKAFTVGTGLWALDLAGRKPDETTSAMVTYLLKNQQPDGHFELHSIRPPMEESRVTTAVLAAYFAQKYATEDQREAITATVSKAREWLSQTKLISQEDHAFRLWGLKLLHEDAAEVAKLRDAVLARQHPDGGWGQTGDMASDAYATGQTLFVLREVGFAPTSAPYQRGLKFLIDSQHADGSWLVETRAKPVQKFFDNGDPHGKHQFISIAATSWAVSALAGAAVESVAGTGGRDATR